MQKNGGKLVKGCKFGVYIRDPTTGTVISNIKIITLK
jgi:hypothetical protein